MGSHEGGAAARMLVRLFPYGWSVCLKQQKNWDALFSKQYLKLISQKVLWVGAYSREGTCSKIWFEDGGLFEDLLR